MKYKASLILVCFNLTPKRKAVIQEFTNHISKQKLDFEIVIVQLKNSTYPVDFFHCDKHVINVMIKEEPENVGLWQKEALINIGLEKCNSDNILIFDTDVYCDNDMWFDEIVERINNHTILQCFELCYPDSYNNDPICQSIGKRKTGDYDLPVNHGLCIAVSREILEKNKGFNPYFIYGGGDSLFIHEYTNEDVSWLKDYPRLSKVVRNDTFKYDYDFIDQDVIHISHREGKKDYNKRHEVFSKLNKSIKDLVTIEKGLLAWKVNDSRAIKTISKLIS
jgi:hypothetical protein